MTSIAVEGDVIAIPGAVPYPAVCGAWISGPVSYKSYANVTVRGTAVISKDDSKKLVEFRHIIARQADGRDGRTSPHQITVADLTGVAVQDIRISLAVCRAL